MRRSASALAVQVHVFAGSSTGYLWPCKFICTILHRIAHKKYVHAQPYDYHIYRDRQLGTAGQPRSLCTL